MLLKVDQNSFVFLVTAAILRDLFVYFTRANMTMNLGIFFTNITTYDGKQYICTTCHVNLRETKIPYQAVDNKLQLFDQPPVISNLRKLEKVIIAKRLLFKKVVIMPKGQQPKMKGAICNVPNESEQVRNILPRGMDNNGDSYW